ncbi:MAG: PhzF family phenazine biosynthesis protein [Planctomycetota bacterium]|jgi:PhzF family phenazine biosynthesis protein
MTVRIPLYQVDAFTDRPFAGNPAAVCLLTGPRDPAWMQRVAEEMNLSETAFLAGRDDGYDLRWFTPTVEVDLCGHATLASAHALWAGGHLPPDQDARFHTHSGLLTARKLGEWIQLDFPTRPPEPCAAAPALLEALGVEPTFVGRHETAGFHEANHLVRVGSEQIVRGARPDFARLRDLGTNVIVTSRSDDPRFDFVSRYFAPAMGIDEDPVTGSAHCILGPYWQECLTKNELTAYQASARGGVVKVRVEGERTYLSGQAVTVLRGELIEESHQPAAISH